MLLILNDMKDIGTLRLLNMMKANIAMSPLNSVYLGA